MAICCLKKLTQFKHNQTGTLLGWFHTIGEQCIRVSYGSIYPDPASKRNVAWCIGVYVVTPDSKVHGANMGPTWVLSAPGGSHVGLMDPAIWEAIAKLVV